MLLSVVCSGRLSIICCRVPCRPEQSVPIRQPGAVECVK